MKLMAFLKLIPYYEELEAFLFFVEKMGYKRGPIIERNISSSKLSREGIRSKEALLKTREK